MLDALVRDGTLTLVALGVLAIEFLALLGMAAIRRRAPARSTIANLLSGLFLILALRAAILDQGEGLIALFLALGGGAHVGDVVMRRRRS